VKALVARRMGGRDLVLALAAAGERAADATRLAVASDLELEDREKVCARRG
jgi:hypothetical protein